MTTLGIAITVGSASVVACLAAFGWLCIHAPEGDYPD